MVLWKAQISQENIAVLINIRNKTYQLRKKHYLCIRIGFRYAFWCIRRRGNQVKILNRPATVSPMQRFDKNYCHCICKCGKAAQNEDKSGDLPTLFLFKVFEEWGFETKCEVA
jgi:hypothetical protein